MGDLVVGLYGQQLGVLRGDRRTFDLVPDPEAPLPAAHPGMVDDIGGFIERLRQG